MELGLGSYTTPLQAQLLELNLDVGALPNRSLIFIFIFRRFKYHLYSIFNILKLPLWVATRENTRVENTSLRLTCKHVLNRLPHLGRRLQCSGCYDLWAPCEKARRKDSPTAQDLLVSSLPSYIVVLIIGDRRQSLVFVGDFKSLWWCYLRSIQEPSKSRYNSRL